MALGFGCDWDESLDDDICLGISPAMLESLKDDCLEKKEAKQNNENKKE